MKNNNKNKTKKMKKKKKIWRRNIKKKTEKAKIIDHKLTPSKLM